MTVGTGTDQGGWTLMSHDSTDGMSNRSLSQYTSGFGDPAQKNVWIGLNLINQMTSEMATSLRLYLFRCARNGRPSQTTDCTYPQFTVAGQNNSYAVTIPQGCQGTENTYYDGWARWDLTQTGPIFTSYDSADSGKETGGLTRKLSAEEINFKKKRSIAENLRMLRSLTIGNTRKQTRLFSLL